MSRLSIIKRGEPEQIVFLGFDPIKANGKDVEAAHDGASQCPRATSHDHGPSPSRPRTRYFPRPRLLSGHAHGNFPIFILHPFAFILSNPTPTSHEHVFSPTHVHDFYPDTITAVFPRITALSHHRKYVARKLTYEIVVPRWSNL